MESPKSSFRKVASIGASVNLSCPDYKEEVLRFNQEEVLRFHPPKLPRDNLSPPDYNEEVLRFNQAKMASFLKLATEIRLSKLATEKRLSGVGHSRATDSSDGKSRIKVVQTRTRDPQIEDGSAPVKLQMHEKHRVVKLTVEMFLPAASTSTLGTLEAHVNGFMFTASSFHMVLLHKDVEMYFLRLGDLIPPLLQFHLQHPIMVGTVETVDIQFHFRRIERQVRSDKDSDNIETDKQTRNSRNEDLMNFVHKVQKPEWTCGGRLPIYFFALHEFECYKSSCSFALTYSSLVLLKNIPYTVYLLRDIQIVNLALQDGTKSIDMTVVFNDFERDVLQIRSIPFEYLDGIKHRLNYGGVKYYVNSLRICWSMLLEDIRKSPRKFLDSGGWGSPSLGLEDRLTLAFYRNEDSGADLDLRYVNRAK